MQCDQDCKGGWVDGVAVEGVGWSLSPGSPSKPDCSPGDTLLRATTALKRSCLLLDAKNGIMSPPFAAT